MDMVDTSVWVWAQGAPDLRAELVDRAVADEIALCHPVLFELLYAARNATEFAAIRAEYGAYPFVAVDDEVWQRALDVNQEMAQQGGMHHRQVRHPGLLIAAAAEIAGLPVIHYDEDYDRIAAVTGQEVCWVRPRGSL